jgi:hypothetical protein
MDLDAMQRIVSSNMAVIVSLCCDRVSSNMLLAKWMCWHVDQVLRMPSVVAHTHPCALHGVSLVMCRSNAAKDLTTALQSLTLWLRRQTNMQNFAEALAMTIRSRVKVRCEPRLAWEDAPLEGARRALVWHGGHRVFAGVLQAEEGVGSERLGGRLGRDESGGVFWVSGWQRDLALRRNSGCRSRGSRWARPRTPCWQARQCR